MSGLQALVVLKRECANERSRSRIAGQRHTETSTEVSGLSVQYCSPAHGEFRSHRLNLMILRLPHGVRHLLLDVAEFHARQTFLDRGFGHRHRYC